MKARSFRLTREQVAELCPSCAESMAARNLAALKFSIDEDGELVAAGGAIRLFAGFSQGMCDKMGGADGFFTRCAETMAGKVDDEKAFCASLHNFCLGKFPSEKANAEKVAALAHSNVIRGVEIFSAPGIHNGDAYTEADLDDMVAAFKDLDFRPAIKVGHTKDKPGAPSYGWVANLRKVGGKLVADFEAMHDSVVAAIKDRRYDRLSSEIYFNLKRGGKVFRRALKAVALLGAEVPAVAGLTPLHKMEFASDGFDSIAACEQSLEVKQQALIDSLTGRVTALTETLNQQKEQDAMEIKELKQKKADLEAQIAEMMKKGDKMTPEDKEKMTAMQAKMKEFGQQIDTEIERLTAAAGESDSLKETVRALQAKDRSREVAEKVAKCTVKSFHGRLEGLYAHAVANPAVKVKQFAVKEGKRTESEGSLVEALDGLVAQINEGSKRLFVVETERRDAERMVDDADIADAGAKVDELSQARVRDGKSKTYEEAMDAVLAGDKDLARAYHEQQNAQSRSNRA